MSTAIPATPATGGDNYAATEAAKQAYAGYEVKADSGYSLLVSLTSETAQQAKKVLWLSWAQQNLLIASSF